MNEEKFEEVRARVIENTHTREDVLFLLDLVESFDAELEEFVAYVLEEEEIQNEDQVL